MENFKKGAEQEVPNKREDLESAENYQKAAGLETAEEYPDPSNLNPEQIEDLRKEILEALKNNEK